MLADVEAVVLVGGKGRGCARSPCPPRSPCCRPPAFRSSPTCSRASARRACGASCSARPTSRRPSRTTSARVPTWAWRSSTSSRTSRWAPVAASATCSSALGGRRPGLQRRRAGRHGSHGRRRHAPWQKADATLHLVGVQRGAFGCVPTDDDGRVTAFLEKTRGPADSGRRRLLRLPPRGDRSIPRAGRCRWSARRSRGCWRRARGCPGRRRRRLLARTWAPRWTWCVARRTWSAASRRRLRCPARPGSR